MAAGDDSLTDDAMQEEIDLVGALVLAASRADGPMTQESIDEALGIQGGPGATPPESLPRG
ncbi:hypothetical protein JQN72_02465 [Phycicoccus sp. CSK15P-2]|uniref:hypothetical protein n=1 Tax=Phycicoccus sp. CSK15P-2 TaxID=2807627 RepID=UPI001951325F|nr:hypothetical protein [Phycicoccus sp. CSK15P-2]MBM6403110.1 hypothetical protein [Phycicoccus sp. CSK15P-2]